MHKTSLFLAIALTLCAQAVRAQEDVTDEVLNQLNLTPAQTLSIRQTREQLGAQLAMARDKHMQSRRALRKQMAGATATDAELTTMFNQVVSDATAEKTLEFQLALKIRAALTPDQRALAARAKRGVQPGQGHTNPTPTGADDFGTTNP